MTEAYRDGELMLSPRELNKQLLALIPVSILPDGAIARQPFGVVTAVDGHARRSSRAASRCRCPPLCARL
jgi:hypothetical protein